MKPSISIIVPIYNVEKYLNRCVDSLLCQSFKDLEVILIDDGSTDNSGKLADQYLNIDSRIKVIHKENGGLSSARNAGLDVATGEYIAFVDSDDWVANDMYEKLYNTAKESSSDIVMSEYYRVSDDGTRVKCSLPLEEDNFESERIIDEILLPMLGTEPYEDDDVSVNMCVWKNLYKRDIIEKYKFRFISERIYISEDIVFHIEVFRKASRVRVIKTPLYYYMVNTLSLTQIYKKDRFSKECTLFEYLKNRLIEVGLHEKGIKRLQRTFIGRSRACIIAEARDNRLNGLGKKINNIKEILKNKTLIECLESYPISQLPAKLRIVTWCMKLQLSLILLMLCVNHKRK